ELLRWMCVCCLYFFFQAEDGIRDSSVTGVQTCALPISTLKAKAKASAARSRCSFLEFIAYEPDTHCRRRDASSAGTSVQLRSRRSEERRVGKECRTRGWPDR